MLHHSQMSSFSLLQELLFGSTCKLHLSGTSMKKWFCSCALLKISLCSNNQLKMIQQKVNIEIHYYFVNDKIRT